MNFTPRQLQILRLIHSYQQRHRYSPTYSELATQLGVSTITVFEHLEALERKGAIRRRRHEARSVEITEQGFLREQAAKRAIPIQGVLEEGQPISQSGRKEEAPLGQLVPVSGRTFLLKVKGNHLSSMHILDGDYLVTEERTRAMAGEQIVAELADGTVTVGIAESGKVILPASDAEEPVRADYIKLIGQIRGLLRRNHAKTQLAGGMAS